MASPPARDLENIDLNRLSSAERRRLQNRYAQRKYRSKKKTLSPTEHPQHSRTCSTSSTREATFINDAYNATQHLQSQISPKADKASVPGFTYLPSASSERHSNSWTDFTYLFDETGHLGRSMPSPSLTNIDLFDPSNFDRTQVQTSPISANFPQATKANSDYTTVSTFSSDGDVAFSGAYVPWGQVTPPQQDVNIDGTASQLTLSPNITHASLEPKVYPGLSNNVWRNPLHVSVMQGHFKVVQTLIQRGVNVNERDSNGCTALHLAARGCNTEMPSLLLEAGADVNALDNFGWSPLHHAANLGNHDVVHLLSCSGANPQLRAKILP